MPRDAYPFVGLMISNSGVNFKEGEGRASVPDGVVPGGLDGFESLRAGRLRRVAEGRQRQDEGLEGREVECQGIDAGVPGREIAAEIPDILPGALRGRHGTTARTSCSGR